MLTSVNRNLTEDQLNYLHKEAYTGGVDFIHKWHKKDWEIDLSSYFSRVQGSEEAISNTQKSWIHGFERPDASYIKFDSTRTSLSGQGGKIVLGKYGGKLKFMAATAWKSPGLELNDIGYMRQADDILEVIWVGYRIFEPFSIFREMNLNFNQWTEWNFAGESTGPGGNINAHMQFKNYWYLNMGGNINGQALSTTELRGGPALKIPGSKNFWMSLSTNEQKKVTAEIDFSAYGSDIKNTKQTFSYGTAIGYRPSKNLKITLTPNFTNSEDDLQYVTQSGYGTQTDYVFARIHQKTLSASLRVNYNITPDLSIQYWGQPFLSSGKYTQFKKITHGRAINYTDRFRIFPDNELVYNSTDGKYQISDQSGNNLYTFDQPDFNVKEFLSNMVVRWEYKPGSTIYLVWSQNRNNTVQNGNFNLADDMKDLFDHKPYNVFLLKASFRIGR